MKIGIQIFPSVKEKICGISKNIIQNIMEKLMLKIVPDLGISSSFDGTGGSSSRLFSLISILIPFLSKKAKKNVINANTMMILKKVFPIHFIKLRMLLNSLLPMINKMQPERTIPKDVAAITIRRIVL